MRLCFSVFAALALVFMTGCVAYVKELHKGPYPYTHEEHESVLGIDLSYAQYGLKLGLIRHHDLYLPNCTNRLYTATFDDTFSMGQSWSDTSVKESIVTGYEGPPPAARFSRLFDFNPKLREFTNSVPK
jgi:hypothetical protein